MALPISPALAQNPVYSIREAMRRDIPGIAALWQEMMAFHSANDPRFQFAPIALRELEHHLVETIRSRDAVIFVGEAGGRPVGYILGEMHTRRPLYPIGTYGFISDISVAPEWRRHGVGTSLVSALLAWFKKKRATAVELFVAETNPVSEAFWASMGFQSFLRLQRLELE